MYLNNYLLDSYEMIVAYIIILFVYQNIMVNTTIGLLHDKCIAILQSWKAMLYKWTYFAHWAQRMPLE